MTKETPLFCFKTILYCFETGHTDKVLPEVCNHVPFQYHPHLSHRKACGHCLLREVVTKSNKSFTFKTYCYHSIEKSMTAVLSRADLLDQCEHWRSQNIPENVLADVYDGRVWKEFLTYKSRPFLTNKHNIGLMLNCDWFQPFEHTNYSVGVLYLVILNLPCTKRFKPENVLSGVAKVGHTGAHALPTLSCAPPIKMSCFW